MDTEYTNTEDVEATDAAEASSSTPQKEQRTPLEMRLELGFLTEQEYATLTGRSIKRIRNARAEGSEPPVVKFGSAIFYRTDDLINHSNPTARRGRSGSRGPR